MVGNNLFSGLARAAAAVFLLFAGSLAQAGDAKPVVVATLFPQFDFARSIAGDLAEVRLLLPPGAESHSFEPTPSDMKTIAAADLFIYTGEYMEPWAKRMVAAARPDDNRIVDASKGIALRKNDEPRDGHDHTHDHDHGHDDAHHHDKHDHDSHHEAEHGGAHFHEFDPHIWLDPILASIMIDNIANAFAGIDAANADSYRQNADALKRELAGLDAWFRDRVAKAPRKTLVFGDRFAFAYFFNRYGLEEVGPYRFCAPGAEPGLQAVIATIKYVKDNGVRFIYKEAMSSGRTAVVLRKETGVEILDVDSLHNPPAAEQAAGAGFVAIMRRNMEAFARGLE